MSLRNRIVAKIMDINNRGLEAFRRQPSVPLERFFDLPFYSRQASVNFETARHAAIHYLQVGAAAGMEPNAYFDAKWYAARYGLQGSPAAALLDYAENGVRLNRNPSTHFEADWYLRFNPTVAQQGAQPLLHYLHHGRAEGRSPTRHTEAIKQSRLFDLVFYNSQLDIPFADVAGAASHYLREGAGAGLNPNPFFDSRWYIASYLGANESDRNPLIDFIEQAPRYIRNPSAAFDCQWYLSRNRDVAKLQTNPLLHFLVDGLREERPPSPFLGDPAVAVATRFKNLFAELVPRDGEVRMQATLDVKPIPDEAKVFGTLPAAAVDQANTVRGDRADVFPPKPYVATFHDVGIIGGTRLILTSAQTVLSDEISTFADSPGWAIRPHDIQRALDGSLRLTVTRRYPSSIERGAHLMHEYASNYFHMITEVLPRLLAADAAGLDPTLPLLIQEKLHPNLLKLLDIVNPHGRQLVLLKNRQLYSIGELHYLSDVASIQDVYKRRRNPEESVLHLGLLRELAKHVVNALAPAPVTPWRRVYVRRGNHYRGLINENAVEEMLLGLGFEVVLLDGLSLTAQVQLFRQSKIIIAPTGAALTNILWSQPGTQVCTLSAQHDAMPTEIWEQVGAASGCIVKSLRCKRAFNVDGDYSLHDDYSIDLAELQQFAKAMEADQQEATIINRSID